MAEIGERTVRGEGWAASSSRPPRCLVSLSMRCVVSVSMFTII